eukprot:1151678-Pelagomonas_calceolata.AAC.1
MASGWKQGRARASQALQCSCSGSIAEAVEGRARQAAHGTCSTVAPHTRCACSACGSRSERKRPSCQTSGHPCART